MTQDLNVRNAAVVDMAPTSGNVIVVVGGEDQVFSQEVLGINMDSSNEDILTAVNQAIEVDLREEGEDDWTYTVRKATNSENIYVYPKPVAG